MGFTAGQKITLDKAALYVSSDAKNKAATKSGTFYIWSAAIKNGRIRITDKQSYCGKTPAGKYVTGWINTSVIPSATASTKAETETPSTLAATPEPELQWETLPKAKDDSDVTPQFSLPGQMGYLGQVVFIVSNETVRTINNFVWSSSASYVTHDRHMKRSMTEFTGINADEISFTIQLSRYLGTNPTDDYIQLLTYQRSGTAVPFKIGKRAYGFYRWVITSLEFHPEPMDRDGEWSYATVNVKLLAYEKASGINGNSSNGTGFTKAKT